jgi:hypothetical protein
LVGLEGGGDLAEVLGAMPVAVEQPVRVRGGVRGVLLEACRL